ncbi:MAG: RDD family protein [Acidimicrobiales bacterium]
MPQPPAPAPFQPGFGQPYPPPGYGRHVTYASWGARLGAYLLDGLIVGVPFWILGLIVGAMVPTEITTCSDFSGEVYLCEQPTTAGFLMLGLLWLVNMAVSVAYFGWWQGQTGQTLGKKALNIRVVHEHSLMPLGGGRGIGRMFATFLSAIPCGLGYLWPLWDDKNQAFHDKIVSSVVLKDQGY